VLVVEQCEEAVARLAERGERVEAPKRGRQSAGASDVVAFGDRRVRADTVVGSDPETSIPRSPSTSQVTRTMSASNCVPAPA
jgi:hypothetical protein